MASYALLLEIIAKECGLTPGLLTGQFGDCHIYENHLEQIKEQMANSSFKMPTLKLPEDIDTLSFTWDQAELIDYECHAAIKGEIAV